MQRIEILSQVRFWSVFNASVYNICISDLNTKIKKNRMHFPILFPELSRAEDILSSQSAEISFLSFSRLFQKTLHKLSKILEGFSKKLSKKFEEFREILEILLKPRIIYINCWKMFEKFFDILPSILLTSRHLWLFQYFIRIYNLYRDLYECMDQHVLFAYFVSF